MFHEYFSDMRSSVLPKRQQNLIDLLLSFEELSSNRFCALPARANLAS
jgi:hypothetical protein